MKLSDDIREIARENARRFLIEKTEDEVKDVFRHADFYSNATHGVIDTNAYFMDCGLLSPEYQEDGRLYVYTGLGMVMAVTEKSGWQVNFKDFVDLKELRQVHAKQIRHVEFKQTILK